MAPFDLRDLAHLLPHRYPFLLVDRILELTPGEHAVGVKNVTINEPSFTGHFPGYPVMPGVLILEMAAQVVAAMVLALPQESGKLVFLAGVERARFRKPVRPGDALTAEVTLHRRRGALGWAKAKITVDGVLVCDASVSFAIASQHAE